MRLLAHFSINLFCSFWLFYNEYIFLEKDELKKYFRVLLLENVRIKRASWPTFPSGRAAAEGGWPQAFGCISAIFLGEHNCESSENTQLLILPGQARVEGSRDLPIWMVGERTWPQPFLMCCVPFPQSLLPLHWCSQMPDERKHAVRCF